jgi:hypothetical protein
MGDPALVPPKLLRSVNLIPGSSSQLGSPVAFIRIPTPFFSSSLSTTAHASPYSSFKFYPDDTFLVNRMQPSTHAQIINRNSKDK